MTDNKIHDDARAKDGQVIERAQNRLKKAHSRKKRGGWRAVASDLDLNVRYVYDLAVKGIVPPNPETRRKLGLPRVMPSERKLRARKTAINIWEPGGLDAYLRVLSAQSRRRLMRKVNKVLSEE